MTKHSLYAPLYIQNGLCLSIYLAYINRFSPHSQYSQKKLTEDWVLLPKIFDSPLGILMNLFAVAILTLLGVSLCW